MIDELNGLMDTFPNPKVSVYCPKGEVTVHLYQHDRELVRSLYLPVDR